MADRAHDWCLNDWGYPADRRSACGHVWGIQFSYLGRVYLELPGGKGSLAIFYVVSKIERFFPLQKFIDPSVKHARVEVFKGAFYVSCGVQLIPNPRIFHILLILAYDVLLLWINIRVGDLFENRITCLQTRLDSSMRAFDFQNIHKTCATSHQNSSRKRQFGNGKVTSWI